jgi:hypothetical protein
MTTFALALLLSVADATVLLNQARYAEAIALFDEVLRVNPNDADALEGRGKAYYWSGDWRRAVRDFRRVSDRPYARQALSDIASTMRPSQQIAIDVLRDDQPLDVARGETSATFFSDPLTRWTVAAATSHFDGDRRGTHDKPSVRIDNDTKFAGFSLGATLGVFDGRPIGGLRAAYRELSLRIDRREEVAAATSLGVHAFSTTAALRWSRERERLLAAAEVSHRRYFDDNDGHALVAYAITPWRRGAWTLWSGASVAARDTSETRFATTAVSSTFDPQGFFRYQFRGEYDPYWTPDDLREVRAVVAIERTFSRGRVKVSADGGFAQDRGRAFGPDSGLAPLPARIETYAFDRSYRPYRAGLSLDLAIARGLRFEVGFEHGATVDYRSNSLHAALVRRR